MNVTRTSVLFLAVGAATGCTAYRTLNPPATVDCSVESPYVFDFLTFSSNGTNGIYAAGDTTVGASAPTPSTTPTGGLCDNGMVIVITGSHNNDWGDLVGFYGLGMRDESAYEGVSFWAAEPGPTGKSFTLALEDANTYGGGDAGMNCVPYNNDASVNPSGSVIDPLTGMAIAGATTAAPPPNACGNDYAYIMTVTADWRFYTVPFTQFHQSAMPNRVPNPDLPETGNVPGSGLLTNKLMNIIFRMPRSAETDLSIANLGFYRKKAPGEGNDSGVDGR